MTINQRPYPVLLKKPKRVRAPFLFTLLLTGVVSGPPESVAQEGVNRGSRENSNLRQLEQEIREQKSIEASQGEVRKLQERLGAALQDVQSIKDTIKHVDNVVKKKACLRIPRIANSLGETVADSRKTLRSVADECAQLDRSRQSNELEVCRAQEALLQQRLSTLTNEYDSLVAACEIATQ